MEGPAPAAPRRRVASITSFASTRCGAFALTAVLVGLFAAPAARATTRHGGIQISGNLSAQGLFRIQDGPSTFSGFHPVQERNTFRLQYEQQLVNGGKLLQGMADLPFIRSMNFFAYYRARLPRIGAGRAQREQRSADELSRSVEAVASA
ncbi:MAG: hypothetical protein QOD06_1882 [Candidatus Binatota bacterium]|nr:hypothetical protein [Candidatus Binatota bacterium]